MSDKLRKYEALFILDAAIQEEAVKDIVERIQKDIENAGGRVETVQKMGQRPLARNMKLRSAGYYANFIFKAPQTAIHGLDAKFHLETDLLRWHITDFVPEPVRKRRTQPATALSGE